MSTFDRARWASMPVPFRGPNGRTWARALGGAQDAEAALLRTAGICRSTSKAPDDALSPVVGSLYSRAVAPREANNLGAYRERLGNAWPFWGQAPYESGIRSFFDVYAVPQSPLPPAPVIESGGVAGWPYFSQVISIWPGGATADGAWDSDSGTYDDGGLWGLAYDPSDPYGAHSFGVIDLDWFRREYRLCKGAQAYPTIIATAASLDAHAFSILWDDGGIYDDGGIWDDPATPESEVVILILGHTWEEEPLILGGGPGAWDGDSGVFWDDGVDTQYAAPTGGW